MIESPLTRTGVPASWQATGVLHSCAPPARPKAYREPSDEVANSAAAETAGAAVKPHAAAPPMREPTAPLTASTEKNPPEGSTAYKTVPPGAAAGRTSALVLVAVAHSRAPALLRAKMEPDAVIDTTPPDTERRPVASAGSGDEAHQAGKPSAAFTAQMPLGLAGSPTPPPDMVLKATRSPVGAARKAAKLRVEGTLEPWPRAIRGADHSRAPVVRLSAARWCVSVGPPSMLPGTG